MNLTIQGIDKMDNEFLYQSIYLTDDEYRLTFDELNKTQFASGLDVFKDHCGFKNGEIHTFVGTKGSGKSTWSKTILSELVVQGKNVFLYLSEETVSKYSLGLNTLFRRELKDVSRLEGLLNKIIAVSELDDFYKGFDDPVDRFFNYLEKAIDDCSIDIIVFDNFTTSFLSEININKQSESQRRLKEIATKYNLPILIFFHTSKNYNSSKIDGDNVRGSATAVNISSYSYVIQQFKTDDKIRNIIHTEKARYHNKANKKYYEAFYNYESGIFDKCKQVSTYEVDELSRRRY